MLECRACVLHCIRAIAGDTLKARHLPRTRLLLTPRLLHQHQHSFRRRALSTAIASRSEDLLPLPGKQNTEDVTTEGGKKEGTGIATRDSKALQIELRYLQDPAKLAEHVHYTLRCNKPEKALQLCRLASKKEDVVVSWNHCVDWYMRQGKTNEAIKIYNEMKKRAQFPDAYTYTLLLRGLAKKQSADPTEPVREENVVRALSIYNSLSSPTSRVKPSIYHTNAALTVCSAALDTDALWGILSQLPSAGARAPDHMTYAIILHAIQHGAFGRGRDMDGVTPEQIARRRQKAVQEGRGVWQEVVRRWRAGEVLMDEELVCAMGRLLLFSRSMRDWDDVLSLVRQTMGIERLVPEIGTLGRNIEHVPQDDTELLAAAEPEPEGDSEGYTDTPAAKVFNPVRPLPPDASNRHRPTSLIYAQPGNPTLSMLLTACTILRTPKTATAYWELLTSPAYNVRPDLANFHAQLRLFRRNRASAQAVRLLKEDLPRANLKPSIRTFQIAMDVCARDIKNHNVLSHARDIIDIMDSTTVDPDPHTLVQYLNLSHTTSDGAAIVSMLDRLDPIVHNLRSRMTNGLDEPRGLGAERDAEVREGIVGFFRALVRVVDSLMARGLGGKEKIGYWHARRNEVNAFTGRAKGGTGRRRRGLGVGVDESGEVEVEKRGWMRRSGDRVGRELPAKDRRNEDAAWSSRGMIELKKRIAEPTRAKRREEGGGFADSPMELAMREASRG